MDTLIDKLLVDFGPQGIIIVIIFLLAFFQNNKLNKILISLEKKVPFEWIEDKLKEFRTTETCDAKHEGSE